MVEQVEHLVKLSNTPHVELGVVDWHTPVEVFPHTAFHLYDEVSVVVGTRDGTAIINDSDDYRSLMPRSSGPTCG